MTFYTMISLIVICFNGCLALLAAELLRPFQEIKYEDIPIV